MRLNRILKTTTLVLFSIWMINAKAQTPVYFNIISHNESSDPLDYDGSSSDYNIITPLVKELCDTIISKQAKYNMQVDANYINGVLTWDNGASSSTDILEWANNSSYIDVDGHNHFVTSLGPSYNPYNYSDLAHLLDSCGIVLSHKILGGVTYADTVVGSTTLIENWTQYSTPAPGYSFPNFLWQADVVWGTASPGHVADYTHFGVWKPAGATSPTQFGQHDPNATITHIGGGCKEDVGYILNVQSGQLERTTDEVILNIKSVVDGVQTLPSGPNDFYTMNMLINFRDIPNIPSFADSIAKIIDGIQDYVDQGKIVWATLGEKYDLWYTQHTNPNDYFNYDCADVPLGIEEINGNSNNISAYPNPTTDQITFSLPQNTTIKTVEIYNLLGEKIYTQNTVNSISLSHLENGVYIIKIIDEKGNISTQKIIKN